MILVFFTNYSINKKFNKKIEFIGFHKPMNNQFLINNDSHTESLLKN